MSTIEEIWDDSALVDAFNDAVQQYKESHGEKKVIENSKNTSHENHQLSAPTDSENNEADSKSNVQNKKRTIGESLDTDQSQLDTTNANDTQQHADYTNTNYGYDYSSYYPNTGYPSHPHQHQHSCTHQHPYPPPFMPMMMPSPFFPFMPFGMPNQAPHPSHLDGMPRFPAQLTCQDENLSQLLMSWYYAGYQTGFHQGKKQRAVQDSTHNNNISSTDVHQSKTK